MKVKAPWALAGLAHSGGELDSRELGDFLRKQRVRFSPPDLEAALIELNLTTLARRLRELLAQAEGQALSFSDFLARAVETERQSRRERRVQRSGEGDPAGLADRSPID